MVHSTTPPTAAGVTDPSTPCFQHFAQDDMPFCALHFALATARHPSSVTASPCQHSVCGARCASWRRRACVAHRPRHPLRLPSPRHRRRSGSRPPGGRLFCSCICGELPRVLRTLGNDNDNCPLSIVHCQLKKEGDCPPFINCFSLRWFRCSRLHARRHRRIFPICRKSHARKLRSAHHRRSRRTSRCLPGTGCRTPLPCGSGG